MSADAQPSYLEQLLASGLLLPTGVDGLYGRNAVFSDVMEGLVEHIGRWGRTRGAERLRYPPAMPRERLVRAGYFKSFPQLVGTLHAFCGSEREHQEMLRCIEIESDDWLAQQMPTDLALTPAACYPVYPFVAQRGRLPVQGSLFDVRSWCFRHEPSIDPVRQQMFQMQEYVRIGSAEQVLEFRSEGISYGRDLFSQLALPYVVDVAHDPFFGRSGELMAGLQRDRKFKFELLVPMSSADAPTACMSFNYHGTHFGETWGIVTHDGGTAHTACVGFGLERITLALFRHFGFDPASWPAPTRALLWGGAA